MTAPTVRRPRRRLALPHAALPHALLLSAALGLLCAHSPAQADAPKNSILSIKTVFTDVRPAARGSARNSRAVARIVTYDIAVSSTSEFPMGDEIVTLSVGGQEFSNSHYLPGGTQNTLVFTLTSAQFQGLKSGSPVVLYYGRDNAAIPAAQWSFGPLDTAILDRAASSSARPAPRVAPTRKGK